MVGGTIIPANLEGLVAEALRKAVTKLGMVNILIAGRTGVGKSTLINSVFQGCLAETGQGRPVTTHVREITKEGIPLSIFDTRGLEMADFGQTIKDLETFIQSKNGDSDPMRHIHVGWICISEDSRRVERAETELAEMLAKRFPVIGVVTKARADNGFRTVVQDLMPTARNVVRVLALGERQDDGHVLPPRGLVELIRLTNELVPEGQRNALAASQRVDVEAKRMRAHAAVVTASLAAAGAGASPIPFSDALILVPIQISMLATITAVFGLPLSTGFLATLVSSAAGCSAATFVGRTLVSNLLKMIPGAGTLVGGAISATTAAAFTTMLGEAYIAVLTRLFKDKGIASISEKDVAEALTKELSLRKRP